MRIDARAEAVERLETIQNRAADEDGRDLTDDEQDEVTQLRAQIETLDGQIESLKADADKIGTVHTRAEMPAPRGDTADGEPGDKPKPKGSPVYARAREVYERPQSFLRDLLHVQSRGLSGVNIAVDPKAEERMEQHNSWVRDNVQTRAVDSGDLPGIVNPMYRPDMTARGLHDGAVTAALQRGEPMPARGDSVTVPRVTGLTSAGVQSRVGGAGEGSAAHMSQLSTTPVKFNVFTVAAQMPVSVQAIERGEMPESVMQDELVAAYYDDLNLQVLFGDNDAGDSGEPLGILNGSAANTLSFDEYDQASAADVTAINLRDQIVETRAAIALARKRRANAIITGVLTGERMVKAKDSTGRPLWQPDAATAQNVVGVGRAMADVTMPDPVFFLDGVPVFEDPAIPATWADGKGGAMSGGSQGRVIVTRREDNLLLDDGPQVFSYEQPLAGSLQVMLLVRGYAGFTSLWYPSSTRIIYGTGTALS